MNRWASPLNISRRIFTNMFCAVLTHVAGFLLARLIETCEPVQVSVRVGRGSAVFVILGFDL